MEPCRESDLTKCSRLSERVSSFEFRVSSFEPNDEIRAYGTRNSKLETLKLKPDFLTVNPSTALQEEISQLRGVVAVWLRIQAQENLTARFKNVFLQVVQKKLPFFRAPDVVCFVSVETDCKRGDQIKTGRKSRQRHIGVDVPDNAPQTEKLERLEIEGRPIQIQSEPIVAEAPANVEKISRSAAEIEDPRRPASIEMQLLGLLDREPQPPFFVDVLLPGLCLTFDSVFYTEPLEFGLVQALQQLRNSKRA